MVRPDHKLVVFAVCLSGMAGFIDALGFINMGGIFVSFMSGNSTRLGVGMTNSLSLSNLLPGIIIILFVFGVVFGSVISRYAKARRVPAILGFVSGFLFIAALLHTMSHSLSAMAFMVIAMGAVNILFEKDGEVKVGITYMTGTLVRMGQRLAAIFWGGPAWAWLKYAFLWLGLVAGAVVGAWAYSLLGLTSIWIAVGLSLALTVSSRFIDFQPSKLYE